jgi:hypothetical protein
MTDRELLELAAKAAGITGVWDSYANVFVPTHGRLTWSPLTDDGDALRLAVKLRFDICTEDNDGPTHINVWPFGGGSGCSEAGDTDPYAATRRAIVRAAAEIGKELK